MERLWSPWRLPYVTGTGSVDGCIFCDPRGLVSPQSSRDDLVLFRGRECYVILNLYPYNNGHLMVVPNRHVATLAATTADELAELIRLMRHAEMALNDAYNPQGITVGLCPRVYGRGRRPRSAGEGAVARHPSPRVYARGRRPRSAGEGAVARHPSPRVYARGRGPGSAWGWGPGRNVNDALRPDQRASVVQAVDRAVRARGRGA